VEEVYIFCVDIVGIIFEDAFGDVIKDTSSLHHHNARSNLVRRVRSGEFLNGQRSESVYPCSRHRDVPSAMTVITEGIESLRGPPGRITQPPTPATKGPQSNG